MFLKDLLFPKFCLGCGFLGAYICSNCQKKLSYISKDVCLYCGKASLWGLTHPGCRRNHGVDGLVSIFYYNNLLKKVIKSIKYRLALDVWEELCLVIEPDKLNKIAAYKKLNFAKFFLQPIPLHTSRLRSRGFNQAKIIASFFSQLLQRPVTEYLLRKKSTFSQAQLKNNKDRYINMRGAFEVLTREVDDKNFILVDDVITTGSTLKEAAWTLKRAGASRVVALTLAKG
ncbi:hypothetical protein A3C25_05200 [Candidatus Roizmanbacteria bacterium RIFCSPHIGHO2_02_FULL_38_11]|uniref:Phosphoribosyltransferase domain-containing protein n=1 Tax=Candidatus Roizmanbacteria bacterium RIFCSPHIGHO2_02_FULL_38_11 TaxID=1802039 RepID=A0A1F7GYG3_9BACT|nr:MAG: hypothetical protein A3C25_05200 [Candidatus Roizmanbacteria bacterium RIFCSPHIGHO2_02_FULL_38_11]